MGFDQHVKLGFFLYQFCSLNEKLFGLLYENPSGLVLKLFFLVKRHDILKHKPENKADYNLATEAKVVAICL